jgi:hypothetical protein
MTRSCIAMFASCIKSGEDWSRECAELKDAATIGVNNLDAEIQRLRTALAAAQREAYRQHIRGCVDCDGGGAVHLCPVGETLHAAWRGDIAPLTEDTDDPRAARAPLTGRADD